MLVGGVGFIILISSLCLVYLGCFGGFLCRSYLFVVVLGFIRVIEMVEVVVTA